MHQIGELDISRFGVPGSPSVSRYSAPTSVSKLSQSISPTNRSDGCLPSSWFDSRARNRSSEGSHSGLRIPYHRKRGAASRLRHLRYGTSVRYGLRTTKYFWKVREFAACDLTTRLRCNRQQQQPKRMTDGTGGRWPAERWPSDSELGPYIAPFNTNEEAIPSGFGGHMAVRGPARQVGHQLDR